MPRVLIADDNPQNAELLDAHLDGTGYETRVAANGEETLALARPRSRGRAEGFARLRGRNRSKSHPHGTKVPLSEAPFGVGNMEGLTPSFREVRMVPGHYQRAAQALARRCVRSAGPRRRDDPSP